MSQLLKENNCGDVKMISSQGNLVKYEFFSCFSKKKDLLRYNCSLSFNFILIGIYFYHNSLKVFAFPLRPSELIMAGILRKREGMYCMLIV